MSQAAVAEKAALVAATPPPRGWPARPDDRHPGAGEGARRLPSFPGELMHGAPRDKQENAITRHLIHVLEKLENGLC